MRLLLEGPAIEPLLERVRTEHGPDARIVHAERVRTGGVGGFFSREHFEVTVEVDAPTLAPAAPGPVGLDALLAAADAAERHDADAPAPTAPVPTAPAARPSPETAAMPAHAPTPWVFPQVSPAGTATLDAFAPATSTLLVEPDPEPAALPVPVAAVPEQRTAPEAEQLTGPVAGPHRPVSTESVAFADLLERLQQENAHPIPLPADHGDEPVRPATGPEVVHPAVEVPDEVVAATVPVPRRGRRAARSAPVHPAGRLAALGLPAELLEQVLDGTEGDLGAVVTRLHGVLADLPVPAADLSRPGAVVLVVGEAARARAAATALAGRHRLADDAVLDLGAPGAAPTADHVRRELARLRGGSTAAVVVVGTDPVADPSGDPWLAAVARTIGADQVVACVDATRKVTDVARWLGGLERLGLPVGALDVHHAGATGDPAAVLGLGVPVVGLDGAPAAASTWSALLLGRLLGEEGAR